MPTSKPRITVTLPPRTYEILKRLAAVGGDSMSALIVQFVEVAAPSMERLVVVLERARAAPEEARAGLAAAVERAERDLLPALMEAQKQADFFLGDIEGAKTPPAAAAAQRKRAPVAPRGRSTPVLVTRGSGTGKTRRKGRDRG